MTQLPVLSAHGVSKRYGDRRILHNFDLEVHAGEVVALLGPNGAGKTTATGILSGTLRRDGGTVRVLGTDPARAGDSWRDRVAVVAQSSPDAGVLSVREQLRSLAQLSPNARAVDEALRLTGLTGVADRRISRLSGGQRRRVDVASAIISRPEVLFLDEPTTGFDPEARQEFWALVHGLRAEGTAILLTTHYLDEAAELAQRLGVLIDGSLRHTGTVSTLGGPEAWTPVVRWRGTDGELHEVRSPQPTQVIDQIRAATAAFSREIPELAVIRPSLEEVYLRLVAEAETVIAATAGSAS